MRTSLWGTELPSLDIDEESWEVIFEIANDQGIAALIPDAFRKGVVPPKVILARWIMDVERTENAFSRVETVRKELESLWNSSGIRYAVLKGSSISRLYPKPEHRPSGDIDFYFPGPKNLRRANLAARRISDIEMDSDGDFHYFLKGVVVEHHRGWTHLSSRSSRSLVPRLEGTELCAEDTLLMISSHILRHSLVGGVGLRQLADLAVATRHFNGKYDKDEFKRRLVGLKLGKWGGLLSASMKEMFDLREDELPFSPDYSYLDDFVELVKHDGNLGKENVFDFRTFFFRIRLFLRVAPRELMSRYFSLSAGRIKRVLGIGRK